MPLWYVQFLGTQVYYVWGIGQFEDNSYSISSGTKQVRNYPILKNILPMAVSWFKFHNTADPTIQQSGTVNKGSRFCRCLLRLDVLFLAQQKLFSLLEIRFKFSILQPATSFDFNYIEGYCHLKKVSSSNPSRFCI